MPNPTMMPAESRQEMNRQNAENFQISVNGRMMREPKRFLYVHTVSRRSFNVTRTLFPRLRLAGCENGERYVTCLTVGDPMIQSSPDQERGGQRIDEHDGWRAVIDLLNPSNMTLDPYTGSGNPDFYANRQGQNLIAEGFFPSTNAVPTEAEIKRAEECVRKHYKWLTDNAVRLSGSGAQKDFNDFLQTYPDVHTAMDALGLTAAWHAPSIVEAFCPNCGDKIRPGVAFHGDCIIDPIRAFKAGKINKERLTELMGQHEEPEPPVQRPRRG